MTPGLFPGCLEPFPIKVSESFLPALTRMAEWAIECRVEVHKGVKKKGIQIKSHLYCGITPKRETSSGVHLRGLAPGQHKNIAAVMSQLRV